MLNLTLGEAKTALNETCPVDASFAMSMCPVGFEQASSSIWGTLLSPFKKVFEWVQPGLDPNNITHAFKTFERLRHKQFNLSYKQFEDAVMIKHDKDVMEGLKNFCVKLVKFNNNYQISDKQLYIAEVIANGVKTVDQLSGVDFKTLVTLYKRLEDSTEMDSIYIENKDFVVQVARFGLTKGVHNNPMGMTVSQAITAGSKVHDYYYQGKTKVATEALYNGMESVSFALPMSALLSVAAPWLGFYPTIAAAIATQIVLALKVPHNYFNIKKKVFSERHQALANYYAALMSGNFSRAKYFAFELAERHDIDVDDIELLAEVEESSPGQIVNQMKGMLASGIYKTFISNQSPYEILKIAKEYQREMNKFNMGNLNAVELSSMFNKDCTLDVTMLSLESEHKDASIETIINILGDIKAKSQDAFLLHARAIANMNAKKGAAIFQAFYPELEAYHQAMESCLSQEELPMDELIVTLKKMREIDMEGYIYYMLIMANYVKTIAYEIELTDCLNNPQDNRNRLESILKEIHDIDKDVYNEYKDTVERALVKKPIITKFELDRSQDDEEEMLPALELVEAVNGNPGLEDTDTKPSKLGTTIIK